MTAEHTAITVFAIGMAASVAIMAIGKYTESREQRTLFESICTSRNGIPDTKADRWTCMVNGVLVTEVWR